jgi:hypothetical protein
LTADIGSLSIPDRPFSRIIEGIGRFFLSNRRCMGSGAPRD